MERNHIHENTLSSLRKTIEDLITSKTGLAAALEQQTMKVARLDEMNRISQVEAEKSQCEVNDVRQSLAEMRQLNARLREQVDEEIVGRASRHCQRAEALDKSFEHGSLTRRGPREDSFNIDKSTEAPNYDTQENQRHEAHVASTLGHSYALIESIRRQTQGPTSRHQAHNSFDASKGGIHVGEGLVGDRGLDLPGCSRGGLRSSQAATAQTAVAAATENANDSQITTYQPGRHGHDGLSNFVSGRSFPQLPSRDNNHKGSEKQNVIVIKPSPYPGILTNGATRAGQSVGARSRASREE